MELVFLLILSGVLLFFGISAFKSEVKSKTNKYFLFLIICIILWIFSNYFSNTLTDYTFVLLSNRFIFFSTSLLAWSLFLFASVYPESESFVAKKYLLLSTIFTGIVLFVDFSQYIVKDITIEQGYSSIEFGSAFFLYVLHFLLLFILFIYILVRKQIKAKSVEKVQLQYLLLGVVFTSFGALATNLILPIVFEIFYLSSYGPSFLLIFVGFTFVSIVRHRFLGIRFLLGKILYFALISTFNLLFFFLFTWVSIQLFGGVFETNSFLASILVSPIYVWIFLKFSNHTYKIIDEKFVYTKMHPAEMLSRFLKSTSTELEIDKIATHIVHTVRKFLDLDRVGVILFDKDNSKILFRRLVGFELLGARDLLQVIQYWREIGDDPILLLDEIKKRKESESGTLKVRLERIIQEMEEEQISAILPLNRKVQLNGILIIGKKRDSGPFSVEDMNFLEDVISNASVAMGRAILHNEVQNFNETLKEKVQEQTKDLKTKVEQLNEARRKEHDMIDIMGHELRTPMTIIRNYYELSRALLKERIKELKDKKLETKYNEYTKIIGENIEREITLINVLLSATKLDDGRLKLNRESVDLGDIIQDGILGHEKQAKEKGLYLRFSKSKGDFPKVYGDKIRLHEIVDNLINNAIKYTLAGGVEIQLFKEGEYGKVEIIDTGVGIHESNIKNMGKKFYRSNQYINKEGRNTSLVRPGGTGLGLFVTFGLVRAHGGQIKVNSKLGKGTTFSFTIPLLKYEDKNLDRHKEGLYSGDMFEKYGLKKSSGKRK